MLTRFENIPTNTAKGNNISEEGIASNISPKTLHIKLKSTLSKNNINKNIVEEKTEIFR